MRCSLAPALALLLAVTSVPRASGEGLGLLPFRLHRDGNIVVPVTVDGEGPFQFLFDTGSSRTVVSDETARRLGLQMVAQTFMVTPAGQAPRALAPLKRVSMGTGPPATVLAMIVAADELARGRDIDGIIGQDILARRAYTIDYERRQVTWPSASSQELRGVRLALEFSEGRLLVSLPQTQGPPMTLQLIPDSGADGLVFFARPGRALPRMIEVDIAALRTLSGRCEATVVRVGALDVGTVRLRDQAAVLVQLTEADRRLGDGLLPLHRFARVTVNVPEGYLIVEGR